MGEIADYYSIGGGAPEPDDLELKTEGRIYRGENNKPTCANCESTNIKTSNKGNMYCGDICWTKEQ